MQRSQSFTNFAVQQPINDSPLTPDNIKLEVLQLNNHKYIEEQAFKHKTIFQQSFMGPSEETPEKIFAEFLNGNTLIREGPVQFRLGSKSFKRVWLQLCRDKIAICDEKSKEKLEIHTLKHMPYALEMLPNALIVKINYKPINQILHFKFNNEVQFKLWFECFAMVEQKFNYANGIIYPLSYFNDDIISEDEFTQIAETGDILLFETDNNLAYLQRMITSSRFDHVAMVIRHSWTGQIMVFDVNSDEGVKVQNWQPFIEYNGLYKKYIIYQLRVAIKKLMNVKRNEISEVIESFSKKVIGKEYQLNLRKLLQEKSRKFEEGYFCSELIAKALKECKLLREQKASSQYWPVTFSKLIKLNDGAYFSDLVTIVLNKDIR